LSRHRSSMPRLKHAVEGLAPRHADAHAGGVASDAAAPCAAVGGGRLPACLEPTFVRFPTLVASMNRCCFPAKATPTNGGVVMMLNLACAAVGMALLSTGPSPRPGIKRLPRQRTAHSPRRWDRRRQDSLINLARQRRTHPARPRRHRVPRSIQRVRPDPFTRANSHRTPGIPQAFRNMTSRARVGDR